MIHEPFDQIAALDAVGAATADESQALAEHLRGCDDCAALTREYRHAAARLPWLLDPVSPPPSVRRSIMDAVGGGLSAAPAAVLALAAPRPFIDPRWYATAAILFLALWGWREMGIRVEREEVRTGRAVVARLEEEKQRLASDNRRMLAQMQELAAPGVRTIALAGQKMAPSASARIFMDAVRHRAVIFFYDMPPNPSDRSYELWIIRADSKAPQAAGTFDVDPQSHRSSMTVEQLPAGAAIKAMAVTLEPRGGVSAPTSSDYYVMGQAGL
jgi:anti-sigma-K factor RskA